MIQAQPETLQTVQSMIAKQLSIDESTVTPQTKFADLGADSLDTVNHNFLFFLCSSKNEERKKSGSIKILEQTIYITIIVFKNSNEPMRVGTH